MTIFSEPHCCAHDVKCLNSMNDVTDLLITAIFIFAMEERSIYLFFLGAAPRPPLLYTNGILIVPELQTYQKLDINSYSVDAKYGHKFVSAILH